MRTEALDDSELEEIREKVKKDIRERLAEAPYRRDVLITEVLTSCEHLDKERNIFLRIWSTSEKDRQDVVRRLDSLDFTFELPPISQVVPRMSSRAPVMIGIERKR